MQLIIATIICASQYKLSYITVAAPGFWFEGEPQKNSYMNFSQVLY